MNFETARCTKFFGVKCRAATLVICAGLLSAPVEKGYADTGDWSCSPSLSERQLAYAAGAYHAFGWVQAMNHGFDSGLPDVSPEQQKAMLEGYCRAYPNRALRHAVMELWFK